MRAQTLFQAATCLAILSAATLCRAVADAPSPTPAADSAAPQTVATVAAPDTTAAPASTTAPAAATTATADPSAMPAASQSPAPPRPKPSPILEHPGSLTLGYSDWGIPYDVNKVRQYATPPHGIYLQQLRYVPLSDAGNLGVFSLEDFAEQDYRDYGQLALNGGKTHVDALVMNSEFLEPTTNIVPTSDRNVQEYYFQQMVAHGFKVSTRYRMDQLDQYFDVGLDPLHQRTRYNDFTAGGRFADGFLSLMYSDWYYWDRTGTLFNTHDQHSQVSYLRDLGSQSIEAKIGTHKISQDGAPSSYMQNATVSDAVTVNDKTDASVNLSLDNRSVPVVQNSYVREQQSATARVAHTWNTNWRGTFAAQLRQAQRMDDTHTYVDEPRWQTFEARLNGRISPTTRLLARASTENCWNAPEMLDNGTLLWTARQTGELRFDVSNDPYDYYVSYDLRRQWNDSQATTVASDIYHFGGDYQALPTVSLNGDLTIERWSATGNQASGPSLSEFAPSSETVDFGVNWTISQTLFMDANYSFFLTANNNPLLLQDGNTSGHFLTVQLQDRLAHGREFTLTVSPWVYKDTVVQQMDSTPTFVMLTATTPF
ncbi:MAG: hypothetical protein P4L33_11615 [Capsulimonadaceae bacterium]|nr:hypothetical protein [Capsulimonadaceae bacterium]